MPYRYLLLFTLLLFVAGGVYFGVLKPGSPHPGRVSGSPEPGLTTGPGGSFYWGLSGEMSKSLADPRFRALGITHARLQVSWDLFSNPDLSSMPGLADEQRRIALWFSEARSAGIDHVLLAFKASRDRPDYLPGRGEYRNGISRVFSRLSRLGYIQMVDSASPWNEPDLSAATASRPDRAGEFFSELQSVCRPPACTPVAGDFSDGHFTPTYFRSYIRASGSAQLWAFHSYLDGREHRFRRLSGFLRMLPGSARVILAEQGGIVRRPGSPPGSEAQAARDLGFLLSAPEQERVVGFYVYQWQGEPAPKWDSGLISPSGRTRSSYCLFARALGARRALSDYCSK